jgi:hypothetical protein
MKLHDAELEIPFEAAFDAQFPYDDPAAASTLIEQCWAISLNAAFCVLHELCCPPLDARVSGARSRELLVEWSAGPDHPLKQHLLDCAHALLEDRPLPWQEGVKLMEMIGQYDAQRAALAIAYAAADHESAGGDEALSEADNSIRRKWDLQGV